MKPVLEDMKNFDMMSNDEKLIELVRFNRIIYDKSASGYKGSEQKQLTWMEIAKQIGGTAIECTKRWTYIRERYSREVRRVELEGKTPEWELFHALSFLRKHVKTKGPRQFTIIAASSEENGEYEKSSMSSDEKLVELVRANAVLYDRSTMGYKGVQRKKQAWWRIAKQMGSKPLDCSNRWKSIRERYSREVRRAEIEGKDIDWVLFDSLSFLRNYIRIRGAKNNFHIVTTPTQDNGERTTSPQDSIFSDPFCDLNTEEEMEIPKTEMMSSIEDGMMSCSEPTVSAPDSMMPCSEPTVSAPAKPISVIQSFGQTVTTFLADMSPAKQAKAMRVLFENLITIRMEPEEES